MSPGAVPLRCKRPPGTEALEKYRDVQLISSEYIAGEGHLKSAIFHAERAFRRKENISTNPFIEVVVRAALNRQIKIAFDILGPKGSKEVIAISNEGPSKFIEEYGCIEDESILNVDEKKYEKIKEKFKIKEKEIMAVSSGDFDDRVLTLQKIINERMALLNKV